jgi:hypothetical protein
MTDKWWFRRKQPWLNLAAMLEFAWINQGKPRKSSVRIGNVLTGIQSEHFRDMSQGNYHCTNQCSAFIKSYAGSVQYIKSLMSLWSSCSKGLWQWYITLGITGSLDCGYAEATDRSARIEPLSCCTSPTSIPPCQSSGSDDLHKG